MGRPQVFISSTFYDLRHIRASLDSFVRQLGYEPILSEKGKIAYDPDIPLDESCYREAAAADIFVLIIGGRYGSPASEESIEATPKFYERYESITKKEYATAVSKDIPVYILVERSVYAEYQTFRKNRDNENIDYAHVESINVFRLLDEILSQRRNNPFEQFDHHTDIEDWLREQWAGLFREYINRRSEQKQLASLSEQVQSLTSLNKTLERYLEQIISSVSESKEEAQRLIKEEKERQFTEKQMRDFENDELVALLSRDFGLSYRTLHQIYSNSQTFDELRVKLEEKLDQELGGKRFLLNLGSPLILRYINAGRKALNLPPFPDKSKK